MKNDKRVMFVTKNRKIKNSVVSTDVIIVDTDEIESIEIKNFIASREVAYFNMKSGKRIKIKIYDSVMFDKFREEWTECKKIY